MGVNAAAVQKKTGFRVSFGPVQARDIPAYVRAGYKKTKEMSTIQFPMLDRLVLTPMEINPVMKKYPWYAAGRSAGVRAPACGLLFRRSLVQRLAFLRSRPHRGSAGAFLTPVLLPFIPFRSFAIKGWIMGMIADAAGVHGCGID